MVAGTRIGSRGEQRMGSGPGPRSGQILRAAAASVACMGDVLLRNPSAQPSPASQSHAWSLAGACSPWVWPIHKFFDPLGCPPAPPYSAATGRLPQTLELPRHPGRQPGRQPRRQAPHASVLQWPLGLLDFAGEGQSTNKTPGGTSARARQNSGEAGSTAGQMSSTAAAHDGAAAHVWDLQGQAGSERRRRTVPASPFLARGPPFMRLSSTTHHCILDPLTGSSARNSVRRPRARAASG